eukprot:CAMPEP_0202977828 /NCGR_PEP_ID=MMETSP1396-20130829/84480_1 /ASSEMBLY_ACC=CAM_ASM_000872 /TAXON_ID= /ORGANISM="Pseudokeronopsis sp., Strain Brazil" /LENGTH=237 /DNA_ID=CAMNT_0049716641 /DNA_START=208 /DNA_END=923 /DNA_ORIENTATION=+
MGVTHEGIEKARDHTKLAQSIPAEEAPLSSFPPVHDAKWRFFWPIGERIPEERARQPKVIPKGFPEWEARMDGWGNTMLNACMTSSEMAAKASIYLKRGSPHGWLGQYHAQCLYDIIRNGGKGLNLPKETFSSRMKGGNHLLAPTGSDLKRYGLGTNFAGFHYDFNFLTIHGRSRYPGLFIWLRNWKKIKVKVPAGCLLLQAGAMFEHLTGGFVHSGFHEVIYTEDTKAAAEKVKLE